MRLPDNLVKISESKGFPPALIMAIILEKSNANIFWNSETVESKKEVLETSKITGFTTEQIAVFLSLSTNNAAAFDFDQEAWDSYGAMYDLGDVNRFLLCCKFGLARERMYELLINGQVPLPDWEATVKDFCIDTSRQIDLLTIILHNHSTPSHEQEKAGVPLGITRLFHPGADIAMPITSTILKRASFIDRGYQKQLNDERISRSKEAPRVPDPPDKPGSRPGEASTRKTHQSITG